MSRQPMRQPDGTWKTEEINPMLGNKAKPEEAPLFWSTPPPWLENIRLEQRLETDGEEERPLVEFPINSSFDDTLTELNSLPYPWLWCGMVSNKYAGGVSVLILRLDVVLRKVFQGMGMVAKKP